LGVAEPPTGETGVTEPPPTFFSSIFFHFFYIFI